MARNIPKNYSIKSVNEKPVDIKDYRKAEWQQTYNGVTIDFRRWLYIGRPLLNIDDLGTNSEPLVNAGRDIMVEAICNAVWHAPNVEKTTKLNYCNAGLSRWFQYLDYRDAGGHPVYEIVDINREVINGFIGWLKHTKAADTETGKLRITSAKTAYKALKGVFQYLVNQRALSKDIFPRNPFPNNKRSTVQFKPYSKKVMTELLAGLYKDIIAVREGRLSLPDSEVLVLYFLVIAARTGRNTWPLLELTRDAAMAHPIKPDRMGLLVTYKRRGNTTSVQAFEKQRAIEDMIALPMDVLTLYNEIRERTEPLVAKVDKDYKNRLWLYRKNHRSLGRESVSVLNHYILPYRIKRIVDRHCLTENGERLILNISRLRKTFAQRIWQLTGGDLIATAASLGNTPTVADQNYLSVTPEMKANFRRVGLLMHAEWANKLDDVEFMNWLANDTGIPVDKLRDIVVGNNNTGVGRCTDPINGAKADGNGILCTQWLECFKCPNQLVMESDLYRLFSFYFLLLKERNFISQIRWKELYSPILAIIDDVIISPNLKTQGNPKGCFDPYRVNRAKVEAESNPHPMWRDRSTLMSVS
jgi:hypothetical protein